MLGWLLKKPEQRAVVTAGDDASYVSASQFLQIFGGESVSGEPVTIESAMGVPAISCAVHFLSSAMASLPIHVYERVGETEKRAGGDLEAILNEAPNDGQSSYDWRNYSFMQTFTGGRQVSFIERNAAGRVLSIWPLDPEKVTLERSAGKVRYKYREGGKTKIYDSSEVIDVPFALKSDGLQHRSPIFSHQAAISMAIAATTFGGAYFRGGGVPPFAITGGFQTGKAMNRAADDLEEAVRKAAKDKRQALVLPNGLDIKQIGSDADKAQLVEVQRFMVEQIARIYGIPPVFLQDLTHGTFTNTEQQGLHLEKHVLRPRVKQFEGELNLKLFGRRNRRFFVRMNLDAVLRGDFKTRMDGLAQAVQNAILTPNEGRKLEGREPLKGGDQLYIQGATVPLETTGAQEGMQ